MDNCEVTHQDSDEKELIDRLKQGQEWAFETLVGRFQKKLLALAYSITLDREESLEIVQDVFVSVYKNIGTFREDSGLATWLRRITVNGCLNWKRKWKRRFRWSHQSIDQENGTLLSDVENLVDTPETALRDKELETIVMKTIEILPEKVRAVFVLKTLEGLSYEEIAATLKIKKGTVSSRLHLARKLLLEAVES